jgi:CRISPR-associated protein Cmr2
VLKFVRDTYPHSLHNDAIISPSVSAGVCIAHYKAPLYEVLATSRQMEQKAKSTDGKDAIGIALMKRSGGMPQFTAKWYSGSRSCVMDIATVSSMLGSRHFSDACLHALDIEMRSVSPMKGNTGWPSMIETEMKRLVERASLVHRLANESEADFEARRSRDVTAMCAALNGLLDSSSDIEHFLSALDICVFLSRESSLSTDGGVLT